VTARSRSPRVLRQVRPDARGPGAPYNSRTFTQMGDAAGGFL
jgi:hypothetical protein